jgi:hypothetical protein
MMDPSPEEHIIAHEIHGTGYGSSKIIRLSRFALRQTHTKHRKLENFGHKMGQNAKVTSHQYTHSKFPHDRHGSKDGNEGLCLQTPAQTSRPVGSKSFTRNWARGTVHPAANLLTRQTRPFIRVVGRRKGAKGRGTTAHFRQQSLPLDAEKGYWYPPTSTMCFRIDCIAFSNRK